MKGFRSVKPNDDLDSVDAFNELLEEMEIHFATETDEPSTQVDHASAQLLVFLLGEDIDIALKQK